MGVGVEGDADAGVPEALGDHLDLVPVGGPSQSDARISVAHVVQADAREPGLGAVLGDPTTPGEGASPATAANAD